MVQGNMRFLPFLFLGIAFHCVQAGVFDTMHKDTVLRIITSPNGNRENMLQTSDEWPPAFCHKLDCPKYSVKKVTPNYEVRQYEASNWVSTSIKGIDYDAAQYTLFMRLFNYISGDNVKKEKIDMTAPVLVRIIPGQGPACKDDFTMSFYMAPKVTDPPKPTNPNVTLSSIPAQTVYVSAYPGFSSKDKVIAHAANLTATLQNERISFNTTYYYYAGYDAPFKIFNRHNEIWVVGE